LIICLQPIDAFYSSVKQGAESQRWQPAWHKYSTGPVIPAISLAPIQVHRFSGFPARFAHQVTGKRIDSGAVASRA
jgi:hypothetical protein